MKLLITWMVCIWASNDMKVNCIVEESKIRWISRKKKKDGSAYSLQLHGSLSEFLVSFRPLWTVTWFIFDYQEALCILIKTLNWVFIFRIVLDWSWVFFFWGLDWSWVVNLSNSSFVTTKHFIILLEIWMFTQL